MKEGNYWDNVLLTICYQYTDLKINMTLFVARGLAADPDFDHNMIFVPLNWMIMMMTIIIINII